MLRASNRYQAQSLRFFGYLSTLPGCLEQPGDSLLKPGLENNRAEERIAEFQGSQNVSVKLDSAELNS